MVHANVEAPPPWLAKLQLMPTNRVLEWRGTFAMRERSLDLRRVQGTYLPVFFWDNGIDLLRSS